MASGSTGSLFPKWQMAILLGAPIALGLGYLYYRNQSTKLVEDGEDGTDGGKDKKKLKDKSISLDGDEKLPATKKAPEKAVSKLQQAVKFKNEGNAKFKSGKFNEAIALYDQAIEACPSTNPVDLSTFYQNRAAAYEQLQKWSAVKSDCTNALQLNTRYIKALYRRAKAHENTNDLTASLEDITATCILEGFQNNSTLLFADRVLKELGEFVPRRPCRVSLLTPVRFSGRRDAKEAFKNREINYPSASFIKTYFASFANDPVFACQVDSAEPLQGFAAALDAVNSAKYDRVVDACTEEIDSEDGKHKLEATLLRGTFYALTARFEEALKDLETVVSSEAASTPLKVSALVKRALVYMQTEEQQKGFEDFAEAELKDAGSADVYYQRGQVHILLERLEEALADFTKAVILAPNLCAALVQKCYAEYRYAMLIQNQVQIYNAIQATQAAVDKFPNNVEAYNILAQILTEQQQFDKADELFEKAIKLAPTQASLYVHRGLLHLQWNGDIQQALDLITKAIEIDDKCELAFETLGTIQVQRGQLENAIELFEKALKLCLTEIEMVHLFSLRNAAIAQLSVAKKLGLDLSSLSAMGLSNGVA